MLYKSIMTLSFLPLSFIAVPNYCLTTKTKKNKNVNLQTILTLLIQHIKQQKNKTFHCIVKLIFHTVNFRKRLNWKERQAYNNRHLQNTGFSTKNSKIQYNSFLITPIQFHHIWYKSKLNTANILLPHLKVSKVEGNLSIVRKTLRSQNH